MVTWTVTIFSGYIRAAYVDVQIMVIVYQMFELKHGTALNEVMKK